MLVKGIDDQGKPVDDDIFFAPTSACTGNVAYGD